jgi:argininosuccinate lyase
MTDLWGGRFAEPLADEMRRFSSSYEVDYRLASYDLIGSMAHAHALHDAGVLDQAQLKTLLAALDQVAAEVRDGTFAPSGGNDETMPEDVHSAVEARLVELCGEIGKRLHAGRSRNDQVVTDMLLWLRDASLDMESSVRQLQQTLVTLAERYQDLVVPSYTHLQRAQPVSLAHQLLAHFEAFDRDVGRLRDARARADRCPLGAGAGTGTSIPVDRRVTAARLGFGRVANNSVDAVADRDWAIEFASVCSLIMAHLSRLAEELILWSAVEFGVARIGDAFSTGSSMMPQKRNPDAAELVRGKAARVFGDLQTLLVLLKGLPLGYNRDLQEDKEALFDATDTTGAALAIMASMLRSTEFQAPATKGLDFMGATDLAEELVRRGVPFRVAHQRVGQLVQCCEADGRGLAQATADELADAGVSDLDPSLLTPAGGVKAKKSGGSTAPKEVAGALAEAKTTLLTV